MTNWSFSEGIAVLMAVVAVFAAVVGPIVTYTVTMKQLQVQLTVAKAQVISPMRQEWINKLRERIAVFITRVSTMSVQSAHGTRAVDKKEFIEMYEISQEILLLLHAGEPEHDAIANRVMQLLDYRNQELDMGKLNRELRVITQKVLKDEWEVTKKMEMKTLGL